MNCKSCNWVIFMLFSLSLAAAAVGCVYTPKKDEAAMLGKQPADFPELALDVFKGMDGGIALTPKEIKGRNTWMLWSGGNQAFWDYLANHSFGTIDLLKTLDTRRRSSRFKYYGIINEPGFREARAPDRYGMWLDERIGAEPEGVDAEVYGKASGILGLRLFPNPAFTGKAKEDWNAERFYTDEDYYLNPKLVRPYRVGMSCGFCHVGPHPLHPPPDPEKPKFEHLSTNVGSQYFWTGRVLVANLKQDNFIWQLVNSSPPGTLDTSFIATDNINNPRTMNAIYNVGPRLKAGEMEELGKDTLNLQGVKKRMRVPHILKDEADSVGILGALSRVYVNIGQYHAEWVRHFRTLIGGKPQTPIEVAVIQDNSVYWRATEQRVGNLAAFFLKAAGPHYLADAKEGKAYLKAEAAQLTRGKRVFAEECAGCHSSKQPPPTIKPRSEAYKDWMRKEVQKPDFLVDNYLSTERRYKVSDIKTNACSTLATNGLRGHIWDNFTSETYKNLKPVGTITVHHPLTMAPRPYKMPGGGRGYHRAPSLVSMWSSAPYFHNNALGIFTNDPTVAGRMKAFQDAVEKLLWPKKRKDVAYCKSRWGMPFCPPIYRTTQKSYLTINRHFLPKLLRKKLLKEGETQLKIGPIPKGTPVNLLASINIELSFEPKRLARLVKVLLKTKKRLKRIKAEGLNDAQATALLKELVPDLLKVSKCPDFVVDRGHEFGSKRSDADKRALIEYLKTL